MAYKAYVAFSATGGSGAEIDVHVPIIDTTNNNIYDDAVVTLIPGTDLITYTASEIQAAIQAKILAYSAIVTNNYGITANDIVWPNNILPRSFSAPTRSLNTAYQISTSRDASVSYSVDIAATISLTTGQSGMVVIEYADNSGISTNVVEVGRFVNGNAGSLTIGLNLTQTNTAQISGLIPASKYVRIRTVNTTGTPTFTYRSGQEVLL